MAWRKDGYYYTNKRVGTRVKTEYVGKGDFVHLLAQMDDLYRRKREIDAELQRDVMAQMAAADAELDKVDAVIGALVTGVLIASGHHTHKRQWRKQRG